MLGNQPIVEHRNTQVSYEASRDTLRGDQSDGDYASGASSDESAVRWHSPSHRSHSPRSNENLQSQATVNAIKQIHRPYVIPELARLQPAMRRISEVRSMDNYDSPPTPNVDDTPYIRYALDRLTREDERDSQQPSVGASEISYPVDRIVPDEGLGYMQSIKRIEKPALIEIPAVWHNQNPSAPSPPASSEEDSSERGSTDSISKPELYIPVEAPRNSSRYPDLTYKPTILRPISMTILMILCLLMLTALMVCAIYSSKKDGLTTYSGGMYNGRYFLFRFLPQFLAAIILLYVHAVLAAVTRIMPFVMMASDDGHGGANALFTRLYPRNWLPRVDLLSNGERAIGISTVLLWPLLISIPLQSSLFSIIPHDDEFKWATVQGIAWTLFVIYILAFTGAGMIMFGLLRRKTGLIWDPRSLADIISLLPRSNNLDDFQDTEVLASCNELREALPERSDRLGYWQTTSKINPDLFHSIAEEGSRTRRYTLRSGKVVPLSGKKIPGPLSQREIDPGSPIGGHVIPHKNTNSSLLAKVYSPGIRFRYIPSLLSDANIVFYPIIFSILYLLILVFSFSTPTSLRKGFRPLLSCVPNSAAFSPAAFLYSFLPSLIGMLVYLCMFSVTAKLCVLTPWAAMNTTTTSLVLGASPEQSILVDYAHSIFTPFATVLPSFRNKHYLITALSVITPLTLLLPILGGGFLVPLTAVPSGNLLMFSNFGAYYTILVLLGLIFLVLLSIPIILLNRRTRMSMRLPHAVDCLAEMLSFLYASQLLDDATFKNVRGENDLRTRLLTSSGTMASSEKRLTGDGRNSYIVPIQNERKDRRGVWDPTKWGGAGGWVRQPKVEHVRSNSYRSEPRQSYVPDAEEWSAWDKEMGLGNVGAVVNGGRIRADGGDIVRSRTTKLAALSGKTLGERPGKRYFLGIFRGTDGRSHLGIERVGREEGKTVRASNVLRAPDVLGRSDDRFARSESRFSL